MGEEQPEDCGGRGMEHKKLGTWPEDKKHTSGGFFIAIDGALPSVVDGEGEVRTIPSNEEDLCKRASTSKEYCKCLQFTFGIQKVGLTAMRRSSKPEYGRRDACHPRG